MSSTETHKLVLTAAEVGELLGYRAEVVRDLVRSGRLPAPIDASISARLWRWSRTSIELYVGAAA